MTATDVLPEGFDLTDPDVNQEAIPHDAVPSCAPERADLVGRAAARAASRLRRGAGNGYWAVSKHEDVAAISKNSKDWSTAENGAIIRFPGEMTREQIELQRVILINQDPPEHTATREIISRGFTPRSIGALEDTMVQRGATIVEDAVARGTGNFVEDVAAELPLQAIADLIGVPQEDRHKLFDWSNQMLAGDDPDYGGNNDVAAAEILGYAMMLAADRKANPRDDLITKLINADKGERGLNDDEFGYFVIMLAVAGNETTRNAITHGMNAFLDNPDQWELWKRDRPGDDGRRDHPLGHAGDASSSAPPSTTSRSAAHRSRRASGRRCSTPARNFDEDVFEDPFTFNILRDPNPHLGFGGHGAHYCIGANLARQEIRVIFDAHRRPRAGHRQARPSRSGCGTRGSTASRTCRSSTPRRRTTRQAARSVRTSGPSAVMATVCSMCAPREPSLLRSVQPSASV